MAEKEKEKPKKKKQKPIEPNMSIGDAVEFIKGARRGGDDQLAARVTVLENFVFRNTKLND